MIKKYLIKFKSFLKESKRVYSITKKPSREEFKSTVKVTGIGIAIIGFVGFVIQIGWLLVR